MMRRSPTLRAGDLVVVRGACHFLGMTVSSSGPCNYYFAGCMTHDLGWFTGKRAVFIIFVELGELL
jgi:hypothetical protein